MKPTVFSTGFVSQAVLLFLTFCLFQSCNTTEPPTNGESPLTFSAIDASCTEIWLAVKLAAGAQPRTLTLQRDTQTILTTTLTAADTLIVDEGLLPNRQYTYTLTRPNGILTDRLTAAITTMDTTSHDWVFDPPVLLGDGSSSVLYDVCILSDTLAYAVGAIYKRDSLGNWDPNAYNMVKWDGNTWELMRIPFIGPCSAVDYPPLKAIWAISANQILLTNGGAIATYNGTTTTLDCRMNSFLTGAINKLYATSAQDIYAVGNNGTIVHYSTGTWRRVESGTQVSLNDVWGGSNRWVGENVVVVAASNKFDPGEKKLIRIHSNGLVDSLSWPMQSRRIHSVWFDGQSSVFTSGGGVFRLRGGGVWDEQPISLIFTNRIRGSSASNIWVVGDFGIVAHFNGYSWHEFPELSISGIYQSVSVKDDLMVAVGSLGSRAVVVRGMR
jgi:hypothetical protein